MSQSQVNFSDTNGGHCEIGSLFVETVMKQSVPRTETLRLYLVPGINPIPVA